MHRIISKLFRDMFREGGPSAEEVISFSLPDDEAVNKGVSEASSISRREFFKRTGEGLVVYGFATFPERNMQLPETELQNMRTWKEGVRYLSEAAKHGMSERMTAFSCEQFDSMDVSGEWCAQAYGSNASVAAGEAMKKFLEKSKEDKKKVMVHCHTHPQDLPSEREATKSSRRSFLSRKPKEYRQSFPPSFMDGPNTGDAVYAFMRNQQYGDAFDNRYRVFDARGVWKYSINMDHEYWRSFAQLHKEYNEILALAKTDPDVDVIFRQEFGKNTSGHEVIAAVYHQLSGGDSKPILSKMSKWLESYNADLLTKFEMFRMLRSIGQDVYMKEAPTQEVPKYALLQVAYRLLGVSVEFETYESLGIQ